ncbi:MAG: hypothetical protein MZV65_15220 [Chromatiales bacterium]|nr:hypothetical protein [Chromatiales bacterium]
MHRAKWLAETRAAPRRVQGAVHDFSRNLVVDIQANLKGLCPPTTLERIEVVNLDAWVRRFLQGRDKVPLGIASKRTPSLPSSWV